MNASANTSAPASVSDSSTARRSSDPPHVQRGGRVPSTVPRMIALYSRRLGCLGSIVLSVVLTGLLILLFVLI
ncbi:hypothetical protein GCM10009609_27640 [Pseudonocardia aurantiaca]